jgi:hypothetical protein
MNKIKKFLFLVAFILSASWAGAQETLNIEKIFSEYGKREGSILIELAKDVLGDNTRISRYKSLIIPSDSIILEATAEAIRADFVKRGRYGNGVIINESKKNGKLQSATYLLGRDDNSSTHEYLLFANKSKKLTLIYIRGNFSYKKLDSELDKLKDLFIEVNNKRIKLQ